MKKAYITLMTLVAISLACCNFSNNGTYQKQVKFRKDISLEEKRELASLVVPSPQQLDRQKIELAALIPFGINTFTGKDWGTGRDNLSQFNPTQFDAEQWIRTLQSCGFELAIITAKHHGGFCLWPTRTTNYSVASTPWKLGRGDVVKEVQEACKKYGMKFGIYISTWDRSATSYGTDYYNTFFMDQIRELLTNYGPIYEIWIDNISEVDQDKPRQKYNWTAIFDLIHTLQPNALTAVVGDDIRWAGNELGISRDTEWSVTPLKPTSKQHTNKVATKKLNVRSKDLGGRAILLNSDELFWYPAEMSIPIRPSWFYKPEQDKNIKSVAELMSIYYNSIGNNSMLLLGIPPNREGLIAQADANRLKEFNSYINNTLKESQQLSSKAIQQLNQGDSIYTITTPQGEEINRILLGEDITKGQRVESYRLEVAIDGTWKEVYRGTTIGYKKIIQLPTGIKPTAISLIVEQCRNKTYIDKFSVFNCAIPPQNTISRLANEVSNYRWHVVSPAEESRSIIDNNITTFWFGREDIIIDLGKDEIFSGWLYTPIDGLDNCITNYSFYISKDGKKWIKLLDNDEFGNMINNPIQQWRKFNKTVEARFIKLAVHKTVNDDNIFSIAELGLLK